MADAARRWARLFALLGVAGTAGAIIALHVGADRWWPAIALLFGPRWLVGIMPLATVPWLLMQPRRGAIPALATTLGFAFGVMDVRTGLGRADDGGSTMRVVEFNMAGNAADEAAATRWLEEQQPAIVFLVECKAERGARIAHALAMQFRSTGSLCLLAQWPIIEWAQRDQKAFWRRQGSGAIARALIATPSGPMRVGIVHLATPRHVLDTFFDLSELVTRGDAVRENTLLRNDESAAAREWIGGADVTTLIGGDFNLPVESAIYRRHWSGYGNAFSVAGRGLGRTKRTRLIGVRIDHVLLGDNASAGSATVGPDLGSDHRPLVVDVRVQSVSARPLRDSR